MKSRELSGNQGFEEEVFTAECSLNKAGDVLYVANRVWPPVPGSDNGLLATFGVGADGAMEARGHTEVGRHPRHFKIDPTVRLPSYWLFGPFGSFKTLYFGLILVDFHASGGVAGLLSPAREPCGCSELQYKCQLFFGTFGWKCRDDGEFPRKDDEFLIDKWPYYFAINAF